MNEWPPQTVRVLRMLEQRGARGLCQADVQSTCPDSGPPIARLASRIDELARRGHRFERPRRGGTVYYVLAGRRGDQEQPTTIAAAAAPARPGLRPADCPYPRHRSSDWHKPGSTYVVCGICHPPVPGLDVVRVVDEL